MIAAGWGRAPNATLLATAALLLILGVPLVAHAQSYSITFQTDHEIEAAGGYDGYDVVEVSGNVVPSPPSGSSVTVTTRAPNGTAIYVDDEPLEANTGAFEDSILTGCTGSWVAGYYTIDVSLNGSPGVNASTTFQYTVDYPAVDMASVAVSPQSLSGAGLFTVTGNVDACSGNAAETSVSIIVKNPTGASIYSGSVTVIPAGQPEEGNFALNLTAGSSPLWVAGTYSATVFYSSNTNSQIPATASTTFVYGETSSATTASASTTPSSSSTASTSTASSKLPTTTTASPGSKEGSGPSNDLYYVVGVIAIVAVAAASFVSRRSRKPGGR